MGRANMVGPMANSKKLKPAAIDSELRVMIDLRHQAEQRGHYEPLGRLLYLKTGHGNILWPVEDGECQGPDVAHLITETPTGRTADDGFAVQVQRDATNAFLLLGPWLPLPPIRVASQTPCPKCRHVCDVCGGEGKKQCEQVGCGGRGTVAIPAQLPCDAPGCSKETGKINPQGCEVCRNTGTVPRYDPCDMCHGSKVMTCPRCKGSGKISTGKVGGSVDWKADDCAACKGTGWKGAFKPQDVAKFVNARLDNDKMFPAKIILALGPIYEFGIEDSRTRQTRIFDVAADSKNDYLMLLIPDVRRAKPRAKAYLVGGLPRERAQKSGAA